jgi:hypothetical protein
MWMGLSMEVHEERKFTSLGMSRRREVHEDGKGILSKRGYSRRKVMHRAYQ